MQTRVICTYISPYLNNASTISVYYYYLAIHMHTTILWDCWRRSKIRFDSTTSRDKVKSIERQKIFLPLCVCVCVHCTLYDSCCMYLPHNPVKTDSNKKKIHWQLRNERYLLFLLYTTSDYSTIWRYELSVNDIVLNINQRTYY